MGAGDVYAQQAWDGKVTDYDVLDIVDDLPDLSDKRLKADLTTERAEFFPVETESLTFYIFAKFKYLLADLAFAEEAETIPAGTAVVYDGPINVTNDVSEGEQNDPAGVIVATVSEDDLTDEEDQVVALWVMIKGYYPNVITNGDDDIAAGDHVIMDSTAGVDRVAAGTAPGYTPLGVAAGGESSGVVAVHIRCD